MFLRSSNLKRLLIVFVISILVGNFFVFKMKKIGAEDLDITPTIHSIPAGGLWNSPSTWLENRVPTESDAVEINGVVSVDIDAVVAGLSVSAEATLQAGYSYPQTLTANGDVVNNGTIQNGNKYLYLDISGNIANDGIWNNYQTKFISAQTRAISGTNPIASTNIIFNNDFEITNSPVFAGQVNLGERTITLSFSEQSMTILSGINLSGVIAGQGRLILGPGVSTLNITAPKIIFEPGNQELKGAVTANKAVFRGVGVKRFGGVTINGSVVVEQDVSLQTISGYEDTLTIKGDITHKGTIAYNLNMDISAGITNDGVWNNYQTMLRGTQPRLIAGANPITSYYIILEDNFEITGNSVLDGYVNFNNKTLTINEPNIVTMKGPYGIGRVEGNGVLKFTGYVYATLSTNLSEIGFKYSASLMNYANISAKKIIFEAGNQSLHQGAVTADEIIFKGEGIKNFFSNATINGSITVGEGVVLQNYQNLFYPIIFNGNVINNGIIKSHSYYPMFSIYVSGNIINNGTWTNQHTYVIWDKVPGASNYEFNITENLGSWPEPIVTTKTTYRVTDLLASRHYWRVRANVGGNWTEWSEVKTINKPEIDPLILQYEPILYLHPDETYQPMNVEAYVGHCSLWGSHLVDELLIPENHENPVSLDDLVTTTDSSNYYLQFGENLLLKLPSAEKASLEYQEMKNNGEVKYSYYATKTIDKDETNDKEYIVLEYWFFYAFNDWREKQGFNNHEGDWEGVIIFLDNETKEPKYIAYSAHYNEGRLENPLYQYDSVRRNWNSNEVNKIGEHIISFVGVGSHANYPNNGISGKHDVLIWDKPLKLFFDDHTSYNGLRIDNNLWGERNVFNYKQLPAWVVNYQGKWGVVNQVPGFSGSSHLYPGMNDRFIEPVKWAGIDKIGERTIYEAGIDTVNFVAQGTKLVFDQALDISMGAVEIVVDMHNEIVTFGENLKEIVLSPHFWDIESSLENNSFNAEVILGYNSDELEVLNLNEGDLAVWLYDETNNIWQKIPSVVDTQNKVVKFFTTHFSRYAIGVEKWQDITDDVKVVEESKHYHKETGTETIAIKIKNNTKTSIDKDLRLMVKNVSKPGVEWLNYTGMTSEGEPYLDIGQPYRQCIFIGAEEDIPDSMKKSEEKKLLKDKPIGQKNCEKIIKKYPQIEDKIEWVLGPKRFTEDVELEFSLPIKKTETKKIKGEEVTVYVPMFRSFEFEVEVLKNIE